MGFKGVGYFVTIQYSQSECCKLSDEFSNERIFWVLFLMSMFKTKRKKIDRKYCVKQTTSQCCNGLTSQQSAASATMYLHIYVLILEKCKCAKSDTFYGLENIATRSNKETVYAICVYICVILTFILTHWRENEGY